MKRLNETFAVVKKDLATMRRAAKLIESFTPNFVLHAFLFSFCVTATSYIGYYLSAEIIDELTGLKRLNTLVILVATLLLSELFLIFLSKFSWRRIRVNQIISQQWEEIYLNNKSFVMNYKNMEDQEILVMRQAIVDNRSLGGLGQLIFRLTNLFRGVLDLFFSALIVSELLFLRGSKPLTGLAAVADSGYASLFIIAAVICGAVFLFKETKKFNKKRIEIAQRRSFVQRILHYYLNDYLDDSKACKDVHMFAQKELIHDASSKIFHHWGLLVKAMQKNSWGLENRLSVVNTIISGVVNAFVALKTLAGAFGVGSFLKYSVCIRNLLVGIINITYGFGALHDNNQYIEKFFEYVDLPSQTHKGALPVPAQAQKPGEVVFHNVSFCYPNADSYAIKDLSFTLKAGERIAIVGMNGSGKTTMIKLLCRLYDPTEGHITLDGTDIRELDYEEYLALFSVVFQDFKLFSFSVAENVAASAEYNEEQLWGALKTSGMAECVAAMPKALQMPIYKDFEKDGVEISGGEAQKLAIARALYKNAPFVILDEPTAALDPVAEYEIYSRFNEMVKDKTAVYISHRLSSCRFCDKIAVFHEGRLIELGGHDELLSERGKYHELWNAQAQYYQSHAAKA
ncbi:MAG: ABC transporter ATP-binding protein/permease [Oscillospiraceae bacterium]|nr:ABC transporter ATP-binding protein/permease [Oscillospiraceae bacterium]